MILWHLLLVISEPSWSWSYLLSLSPFSWGIKHFSVCNMSWTSNVGAAWFFSCSKFCNQCAVLGRIASLPHPPPEPRSAADCAKVLHILVQDDKLKCDEVWSARASHRRHNAGPFFLGNSPGICYLWSVQWGFLTVGKYMYPDKFTFHDFPPKSKEKGTTGHCK